jgi:argininosuccinate lyase
MTLWGGRFRKATHELVRRLNDSIGFDWRLYAVDIQASIVYASALAQAGLISAPERDDLVAGLKQVLAEFETAAFELAPGDEDIHTAVERRLGELVGPVAGKLHTGRSRNDQVATDLRLYLLDEMASLQQALANLQGAILETAEAHLDVIMPGYTHLQQAQPLLFSHWLMSFFWKFQRDRERLTEVARHTKVLPLGSGALAGNPFGIDRQALAAELGFNAVSENSVDAVSDRDYVVEWLAWAALVQIHLSNLAEDLILWSSREFGFVEVDDAYATGSSLMPQKKNPDSLELLRGKSGRMVGHLVGLLTMLKGLPSAYNKDLQEDKEAVFDAVDTLALELPIAAGVIRTLRVNREHMAAALDAALLATDLADYLVRKGVPFRQSHHLVGQAVSRGIEQGKSLADLGLAEYRAIHPAFAQDVAAVLDVRRSVEARDGEGGTAPQAVRIQIQRAKERLAQDSL